MSSCIARFPFPNEKIMITIHDFLSTDESLDVIRTSKRCKACFFLYVEATKELERIQKRLESELYPPELYKEYVNSQIKVDVVDLFRQMRIPNSPPMSPYDTSPVPILLKSSEDDDDPSREMIMHVFAETVLPQKNGSYPNDSFTSPLLEAQLRVDSKSDSFSPVGCF